MQDSDEKAKFIEWLKTGRKEPIGNGDGGFLVPETMPVNLPGWRACFLRMLAGLYLRMGLYGSYWMTHIKDVRFVNTIEYLKERIGK